MIWVKAVILASVANAVTAVLMLPAFAAFLLKTPPDTDAAPAKA